MVDDSTESQVRKEMRKHPGLIGDFLVEFLGGLIPGIIFIVALIFIFSPPFDSTEINSLLCAEIKWILHSLQDVHTPLNPARFL